MEDDRGAQRAPFAWFIVVACMVVLTGVLTGCTVGTPTRSEVEEETVEPTLSSPTIAEDGVLTVAVDTSNAPQAMTDSDGDIEGYDIDVALAVAERLGLSVKVVDATNASSGIEEQGADIYIGTDADDVPDGYTSTDVYLEDATAIFVNTDATSASSVSLSNLESATIGVQDGSASQDALSDAGILATQQTYSNVNECFEALADGEVDCVACDATAGAYLARLYGNVEFAGTISGTSSYTIVMSESNEDLAEAVIDALDDIEADGTLAALHTAWYGDLPTSLIGQQIEGVSVEGEEESSESEVSESDEELMASDDINSLSE